MKMGLMDSHRDAIDALGSNDAKVKLTCAIATGLVLADRYQNGVLKIKTIETLNEMNEYILIEKPIFEVYVGKMEKLLKNRININDLNIRDGLSYLMGINRYITTEELDIIEKHQSILLSVMKFVKGIINDV